jgi:hypothetical protein
MSVHFDPHTLYSRADLIELLKPLGIKADNFIARIRPKKVTDAGWWGQHLIEAITEAPEVRRKSPAPTAPAKPRRGRPLKYRRLLSELGGE